MPTTPPNLKVCLSCKASLDVAAFSRNRRKPDGLDIYCKACTRLRGAAHYSANREKYRARNQAWLAANPGKAAEYAKRWRETHPGAQQLSERRWYEANRTTVLAKDKAAREADLEAARDRERKSYWRNREARLRKNKAWCLAHPERIAAYAAERRASKARRTPPWLTSAHWEAIVDSYQQARSLTAETGVEWHVDHIIPLRGEFVSGLHVPWNLQVIPAVMNLSKSNRHGA